MKISIDADRCTGHGRCYVLAPQLFVDDDHGYGQVVGEGVVSDEHVGDARSAELGCPERAVVIDEN